MSLGNLIDSSHYVMSLGNLTDSSHYVMSYDDTPASWPLIM